MKVELLADKSEEEISEIWREYHRGKDSVCAVIPVETFKKMAEKFNEFKTVSSKDACTKYFFKNVQICRSFLVSLSASS